MRLGTGFLTMQDHKFNDSPENLTLLELALQVQGEFRRSLEPIRVTPLQAGVILYLQRHPDAKLTEATDALCLRLPTLSVVVNDLVEKCWVTRRHSVEDRRALCLSLTRRGKALAQRIEELVGRVSTQINYKIVAKQK
jgi:DNA-binding MarR family transcriptional regulator